jgi:hypothetical protein
MALIACNECSKEYSDQAPACIHCGAKNQGFKKQMGCLPILLLCAIGAIAFVIVIGLFLSDTPEAKARMKDSDTIDFCESEYARMKEEPGTSTGALRMSYLTCEKMKEDFRAKWRSEP